MLDATDLKILDCLLNDARRAHKEIGERRLPAVLSDAARIRRKPISSGDEHSFLYS